MGGTHSGKPATGIVRVGGAPRGHDAGYVAELAERAGKPVLLVTRQDRRLAETVEALSFHAPTLQIIEFPAWDCQPYDRVSPRPDISARRTSALTRLASGQQTPCVVATTVNAVLQRVPPESHMLSGHWSRAVGEPADLEELAENLARNGYIRSPVVSAPGEFAVRGGILDVFGPGMLQPIRLEFAWDRLETARRFDPIDQRTVEGIDRVELDLASEAGLDPESIARFRERYLRVFGIPRNGDPLYASIVEGKRHPGMEHWVPFFHNRLETVFDYVPGAPVALDELAENAVAERIGAIADLYRVRTERQDERGIGGSPVYRPCPPEMLYLGHDEWKEFLSRRSVCQFAAGRVPDGPQTRDIGGRAGRNFAAERGSKKQDIFTVLAKHIQYLQAERRSVLIASFSEGSRARMMISLREKGCDVLPVKFWKEFLDVSELPATGVAVWRLSAGYETAQHAVISEQDVFGDRLVARPTRAHRPQDYVRAAEDLVPGDLVVHSEFGLGRFCDLETIVAGGAPRDCVKLEYTGGDFLRVPVENIDLLYRYGEGELLSLDRLGAAGWQARKARARQRIRQLAENLVRTAAEREMRRAPVIVPVEGGYEEFCARFPYLETEDQLAAVREMHADLLAGRPMDRLICGDVGFGKTEVALRAAFTVAMSGGQVAVIVPTTLLARQHHRVFQERFEGFPVDVEQLTRFTGNSEATRIREGLECGSTSIAIGTHRLLSRSTKFAALRLVVVDEEQQFGVEQKERLKNLSKDVHVLALTATPIPRTLHLALSGIRPMSVILTPPVDRLAIRTYVLPFDPITIREAVLREHFRGGQSFIVAPRIADLEPTAAFLRDNIPEVSFVVAHGRLPSADLEERMNAFYDGAYDLLLSTTIIASGLDIPRVNTLIVLRADMFGLAQLYQIRGRVGRSTLRAYAYFTTDPRKPLTDAAQRRLEALSAMEDLGAGFALANRDLDIRGAGNLLGAEQAGHIREVGTELYREMLENEVTRLRGGAGDGEAEELEGEWSPRIDLGLPVHIPESYIPDLSTRLTLYRRLAGIRELETMNGIAAEIHDRFGAPPPEVETLYRVLALKSLCRSGGIASIEVGEKGARLGFRNRAIANPAALLKYVASQRDAMRLRPDGTLVVRKRCDTSNARVDMALGICQEIAEAARGAA